MFGAGKTGWVAICGHGADALCNCALVTTGMEQSLDEMEFSRSACGAAQDGDVGKLQRILARNPGAVNADGGKGGSYTPLHYAARGGHVAAVECLIKAGGDVNAQTRGMGATPLHRAAGQGHAATVQLLLRAGADPCLADCDGENALHKAAAQGHAEVCRVLLQHPPAAAVAAALAAGDKNGRTPVQRATGAAVAVFTSHASQPP